MGSGEPAARDSYVGVVCGAVWLRFVERGLLNQSRDSRRVDAIDKSITSRHGTASTTKSTVIRLRHPCTRVFFCKVISNAEQTVCRDSTQQKVEGTKQEISSTLPPKNTVTDPASF